MESFGKFQEVEASVLSWKAQGLPFLEPQRERPKWSLRRSCLELTASESGP